MDEAQPHRPAVERLDVRLESGAIDVEEAIAITRLLATTLDDLHVHGDTDGALLPARIELRGEAGVHLVPASAQDRVRRVRKAYTAPELWTDEAGGRSTAASDQFAMAAILYEALCGGRAFPGDDDNAIRAAITTGSRIPLAARVPGLANAVDAVFERALDVSPERRFPSCGAFADALVSAIESARSSSADVLVRKPSVRPGGSSSRPPRGLMLVDSDDSPEDDPASGVGTIFLLVVIAIVAAALAWLTAR
jgi:serine/threonine-protein kinase